MQSNDDQKPVREPNPMVGSLHKYSDGYGYGVRYPTERNRMTLPQSIPQFRHPPPSERFLTGTKNTQLIKTDERSMRRNAEQIVFQTSGELGQYYYGLEPAHLSLNRRPLQAHRERAPSSSGPQQSARNDQAPQPPGSRRELGSAEELPQASGRSSARLSDFSSLPSQRSLYSTPRSQREGFSSSATCSSAAEEKKERLFQTLRGLDPSFGSQARNDLIAATLHRHDNKQSALTVTANHREFLQSKAWILKLRHEQNSS